MENKKEIKEINSYGQLHGYQEWYNIYGQLRLRCFMRNDKEIGYEEWFDWDETNFYIR